MSRKQRLIVILLAIADILVLGGLVGAVVFVPRLVREPGPTPPPTVEEAAGIATLPPTWTYTPSPSPAPTNTRAPTPTPRPTGTPIVVPTGTPAPTATPRPVGLENADFEAILPDRVPGWEIEAVVNWEPGEEANPDTSYGRPEFKPADDSRRVISGSTLQIQTFQWMKFKVTLYQVVDVEPGSRVRFEIDARGFSSEAGIQVRAGIDAQAEPACRDGSWSETQVINQGSGIVALRSPEVVVGEEGQVTVCFFAEPQFALIHNAAYFDNASLVVQPPE